MTYYDTYMKLKEELWILRRALEELRGISVKAEREPINKRIRAIQTEMSYLEYTWHYEWRDSWGWTNHIRWLSK